MKTIKLLSLKLENYMGIKKGFYEFNGLDSKVRGDNGAGKTTIWSAFTWLFWGKNEQGKTQFDIKPYDHNGEFIHNLDTVVEGIFNIDGKTVKLKRVFNEVWNKKRGTDINVFKGHETHYWVDDVPMSGKKEYDEYINSIIPENVFKLITDPLYFATQLDWKEQRDFLTNMFGTIEDEEIAASSEDLMSVLDILDGKTADNFKKMIKSQIKACKDDKKKKPIQIKENDANRPELPSETVEELREQMLVAVNAKTDIETKISDINNTNQAINNSYSELNRKKICLSNLESKIRSDFGKDRVDLTNKKHELQQQITSLQNQIKTLENGKDIRESEIKSKLSQIETIDNELPELRNQYKLVEGEEFVAPEKESFTCTMCHQVLPTDNIDIKINELRSNFNNDKESRLQSINRTGKGKVSLKTSLQSSIDSLTDENDLVGPKVSELKSEIDKLEKELKMTTDLLSHPAESIDFSKNEEWVDMQSDIESFEKNIEKGIDSTAWIQSLNVANDDIKLIESKLRLYDDNKKIDDRIEQLKSEEKILIDQILDLEQQEMTVEKFIAAKNHAIEQLINKEFDLVQFRLFRGQINEGIKDVCDIFIPCGEKLVSYDVANTASKIHAGIDVIKTICKHYQIIVPIFVDNNESIIDPFNIESQIIGLYVSDSNKNQRLDIELIEKQIPDVKSKPEIKEEANEVIINNTEVVEQKEVKQEGTFDLLDSKGGCEF